MRPGGIKVTVLLGQDKILFNKEVYVELRMCGSRS